MTSNTQREGHRGEITSERAVGLARNKAQINLNG